MKAGKGVVMGNVVAVCISKYRGTQKNSIVQGEFIENFGIKEDAHAGNWYRQVSLLEKEKIDAFRLKGIDITYGAFGENLVVEGIDFASYPIGTKFQCKEVILELTQVGKQCHKECTIYKQVGDCIMPREGVFTKVLHGGVIQVGDTMEVMC